MTAHDAAGWVVPSRHALPDSTPRSALRRACRVAAVASCATALATWAPVARAAPPATRISSEAAGARASDFERAVASLREQVQLMKVTPPSQGDGGVRRAVATLADAIENLPAAGQVDVVDAARTMREDFPDDVGGAQPNAPKATTGLRRALQEAAGALELAANGPYANAPGLAARAAAFRRAAGAVLPGEAPAAQRDMIAAALGAGVDALAGFEGAAGLAPRPGAAEAQGGSRAAAPAFSAALSSYSVWIDRFATSPPERASGALRAAFDSLADAVASMPRGAELAPAEVARHIHALAADFDRAPPLSTQRSAAARHVFERAEGLFAIAAKRPYAASSVVGRDVRAFHVQYAAIDPRSSLRSQSGAVLASLEAAERVLRVMALVGR